ncbi:MAG: hypothetical protein AB8B55_06550 [Mariniblastus sp.]
MSSESESKQEDVGKSGGDSDCDGATTAASVVASNLESTTSDLSAAQGTENFIETYHAISEWIRFADAKAAVILTVGGAMAGFLIPTIHKVIASTETEYHLFPQWQLVCYILFGLYVVFFLLSGVYSFLCINPLSEKGKHPSLDHCKHFHPAAIAAAYASRDVKQYVEDCDRIGSVALKREVQAAILLDSHISAAKYKRVKKSLVYFGVSVFFGFIYFLIAQM